MNHPVYGQLPHQMPPGNMMQGHIYSPPANWSGQDRPNWNARRVKQISIALLILCAANVILGSVSIALGSNLAAVATPIWGSLFFCIAGILGYCAGNSKTTCTIVATMVMSIIGCVLWSCVIGLIAATLGTDLDCQYRIGEYDMSYEEMVEKCNEELPKKIPVDALMLVVAFIQGALMLTLSILCCRAVCCCNSASQRVVYFIPVGAQGSGLPVNQAQHQVVFYPPTAAQGYASAPQPMQPYNMPAPGIPGYAGSMSGYPMQNNVPYPNAEPPPQYSQVK